MDKLTIKIGEKTYTKEEPTLKDFKTGLIYQKIQMLEPTEENIDEKTSLKERLVSDYFKIPLKDLEEISVRKIAKKYQQIVDLLTACYLDNTYIQSKNE